MKRDDDIPIEALSEGAWQRIERNLFEELDGGGALAEPTRAGRWPRWALVALAGVVALQVGLGVAFVVMRGDGAKPQALASTRLTSGAESSETLVGDVSIRLEPASALVVVENGARSSLLMLEHGAARFSVPHRGERPAFVVQAGDTRVEVVGTQFRVERSGGTARVEAYEGTVRVTAQGRTLLLTRGQRWSGDAVAADPIVTEPAAPAARVAPAVETAAPEPAARKASDGASVAAHSERERFEQAAALEAADPARALRIYRGLAGERGAWATNALYAMGRLEIERGHVAAARRLLRRYLDRHPNGANAADARALLARSDE